MYLQLHLIFQLKFGYLRHINSKIKFLLSSETITLVKQFVFLHQPFCNSSSFDGIISVLIDDSEKAPFSIDFKNEFSSKLTTCKFLHLANVFSFIIETFEIEMN